MASGASPRSVIANAITCEICCERFTETWNRTPLSLPCGHCFCRQCVRQFPGQKCPNDRVSFSSSVNALPTNFAILRLLPAYRPLKPAAPASSAPVGSRIGAVPERLSWLSRALVAAAVAMAAAANLWLLTYSGRGPPSSEVVNPFASRYLGKTQADIAANRAKSYPTTGFSSPNDSSAGRLIYDAAASGSMDALLPLVDEWFANDGLNWANPDHHGWTPLHASSSSLHVNATLLLLAAPGTDANRPDTERGWTPVMHAAHTEQVATLRLLLSVPGIDLGKTGGKLSSGSGGSGDSEDSGDSGSDSLEGKTALGLAEARALQHGSSAAARECVGLLKASASREALAGRRIYDAAKEGDVAALRPLVQEWSGHDVLNWAHPDKNWEGWTPLIVGSFRGALGTVQLLLATLGIDVNKADNDGVTAVMLAAREGHSEVVRALLAAPGNDVNQADKDGYTAVMLAARWGHTEVVRALLAAPGIDVNKADNDGMTAVMLAAREGHTEIVRALLAAPGIDLNKRATGGYYKGKTAMDLAINKDRDNEKTVANKKVIAALLRVPPEGTGKRIYDAVEKEDMAALSPLVQEWSGNDVVNWANPDTYGWTPLIIGSVTASLEAVQLLLATPGIDVNKADKDGRTALRLAIFNGEPDAAPLLRAAGAEESEEDKVALVRLVGKRIYNAAEKGDMAALRPLVQEWSGPDVLNWAHPDNDGRTPLIIGSAEGKLEAVRLLLATTGIDLNETDTVGKTAVMVAAESGHTEVVRALLAAPGIDIYKRATAGSSKGKTALGLAKMREHYEVEVLLTEAVRKGL